ncbi:MAG: hypothetical protein EB127_24170, partial [Alphaproteobacteria bacterium]|nr:hypothetical protein [Alphaproteobacteria bacterium]
EIESILEVSLTQTDTTEDNLWAPTKRYHSSVGKAIRRIIPAFEEKFNYKDLEAFVSMYKMESYKECGELGDLIYEEFKGEKLRWAYHEDNYYPGGGQLHSSCMRYSYCQKYLDLYTENPERISLAVLLKEGKVAARCLLWHDPANEEIYRDRIYAIDEDTRIILDVKLQHLYDAYNGHKDLFIPLDKTEFEYYPYVDSFQYLSYGEGVYTSCNSGYDRCMDNAEGGGDEEECECCGSSQDPDDLRVIDRGRYQGQLWCSDCYTRTENDEYINSNDAVWCEYVKGYYHCDDVVGLHNEEFALPEDTVETQEGNFYLTEDIDEYAVKYQGDWYEISGDYVVEVDGSYYHQDSNEIILLENGDYCLIENAVQVDGDWYSKDDESIQEVEGEWFVAESDEHFIALGKLKWEEMNSLLISKAIKEFQESVQENVKSPLQETTEDQQVTELHLLEFEDGVTEPVIPIIENQIPEENTITENKITENEIQTNEFIL